VRFDAIMVVIKKNYNPEDDTVRGNEPRSPKKARNSLTT
jgi:hypothetical protein